MNPLATLGLPESATLQQAKAARDRLAHELHPDKGGDPIQFATIQTAYRLACQLLAAPKACPHCCGTGEIEYVSGWTTIGALCRECGGRG
jgi:DnaJ-class molecular chaperone